ncbi:MAG: hypothetical protein M1814_001276 [Vezdaea aestivalis]|nr:MAG: hypothetical protein M1814_001276 [Vezdaea aestivalis]
MASSSPVKMDDQPDIADKIMRRADAAKKARLLVDRLGLASFKTAHGWEHLSVDVLEPKVEQHLLRRSNSRPSSAHGGFNDVFSDTSSTISDHPFPASMVCSSPLGAPIFSDAPIPTFGRSSRSHRKRRLAPSSFSNQPSKKPRSLSSTAAAQAAASLRPQSRAPSQTQSSPVMTYRRHSRWPSNARSTIPHLPFVSESTSLSIDEDDASSSSASSTSTDLPMHSFQVPHATIPSSPPRTPPPTRRTTKCRPMSSPVLPRQTAKPGEEGADLLLYLATSPRSVTPRRGPVGLQTPLLGNDGHPPMPKTPGSAFNYYDFVNVTPSPSQPEFFRTPIVPGSARTPGARRRLNFDSLAPPLGGASPRISNDGETRKGTGLGMELGGELVS